MKLFLLLYITGINAVPLQEIRNGYEEAAMNKNRCEKFLLQLESSHSTPLLKGYTACAKILLAKHSINPLYKLQYFQQGKKELENAIKENSHSIELRYLRYTIQTNIPDFLGYSNNIEEDKELLIAGLKADEDADLLKRIKKYLLHHESAGLNKRLQWK